MYKCEKCYKEFDKIKALQGHQAWHVKRSGLDKVAAKLRSKIRKEENEIVYYNNSYTCKTCSKVIPYEKAKVKKAELKNGAKHTFCSKSCAATFNNSNRTVTKETKKKTSETLLKKNSSTKHLRENNIDKTYSKYSKQELICSVCSASFVWPKDKFKKTCSKACKSLLLSIHRQKYLEKNGNFSTPRESFTYKEFNIEVDSNLEKAGVMYLVDELKANCIERFKNILYYNDGVSNRTYNPDFICLIENQTYIIEVKQKWYSASEHVYNTSIPHKKTALDEYCNRKGYKSLWLDFDSTPSLKRIYNTVLKSRTIVSSSKVAPGVGLEPTTSSLHLTH